MLRVKRGNDSAGYGYQADPVGQSYEGFETHPSFGKEISATVSLVKYAPAIWDQGPTASGVGHAFAGAVSTSFAAHGRGIQTPLCPRRLYTLGRLADVEDDAKLPTVTDTGISPGLVARAITRWGFAREGQPCAAASPTYVAKLVERINDAKIPSELIEMFVKFHAITATGDDKILQICQALATGYAVVGAVCASDEAFQAYQGVGVLDAVGKGAPDQMVYLAGYRMNAKGKKEFLLVNSWGLHEWTPDGMAWVSESFVALGFTAPLVPNIFRFGVYDEPSESADIVAVAETLNLVKPKSVTRPEAATATVQAKSATKDEGLPQPESKPVIASESPVLAKPGAAPKLTLSPRAKS